MEFGDLPHQREPQPCATVLAAAGLVHPEEGLEDTALMLLRDAAASIRHAEQELFRLLCDRNPYRAARPVVLDSILRQIEDQPVDQGAMLLNIKMILWIQSEERELWNI